MEYRIVKNKNFKDIYECQNNRLGYFKTIFLYHEYDGSFETFWNDTWQRDFERPIAIFKTLDEAKEFIKRHNEKLHFINKNKSPYIDQPYDIPVIEDYIFNRYHGSQYYQMTHGFYDRNKLAINLAIIMLIPMLLGLSIYIFEL